MVEFLCWLWLVCTHTVLLFHSRRHFRPYDATFVLNKKKLDFMMQTVVTLWKILGAMTCSPLMCRTDWSIMQRVAFQQIVLHALEDLYRSSIAGRMCSFTLQRESVLIDKVKIRHFGLPKSWACLTLRCLIVLHCLLDCQLPK